MNFSKVFRPPKAGRRRSATKPRAAFGVFAPRGLFVHSMTSPLVVVTAVVITNIAGCGDPPDMRDQRLADFAQDFVKTQKQQNDRIAAQSRAVVDESRHVAEAARDLVRHDAEARREMVLVHADLAGRLDRQRDVVEEARVRLEEERREIAQRRSRDPIIARAVESVGLSVLCLVPVVVSLFVIRQMMARQADDSIVAELLTVELARTAPRLLAVPSASVAAIEDGRGNRSQPGRGDRHDSGCAESDDTGPAESGHRYSANDPGEDPDDDPDAWMGRIDLPEDDDFADCDFAPDDRPDRFRSD